MRETLDISDDVLQAAKERARRENKSVGQVISELARSALTGRPDEAAGNALAARFESQEALALLEVLALGNRQIEAGDVVPATGAVQRLRKKSRK